MVTDSRFLRPYVLTIVLAGACSAGAAALAGGGLGDARLIIGLILAGVLAERFRVGLFGDSHVSVAAAVCMAAAIAGSASGTVVVAAAISGASACFAKAPAQKTAFNVAVSVLASLAFRIVFRQLGTAGGGRPNVLVPASAASAVDFLLNVSLVAVVVSLATNRSLVDVTREKFLWLAVHHLPLGALAVAFVAVYGTVGMWAIVVFAIPLASIQVAMLQYSIARRADLERLRDVQSRMAAVQAELARLQRADGGGAPQPSAAA